MKKRIKGIELKLNETQDVKKEYVSFKNWKIFRLLKSFLFLRLSELQSKLDDLAQKNQR